MTLSFTHYLAISGVALGIGYLIDRYALAERLSPEYRRVFYVSTLSLAVLVPLVALLVPIKVVGTALPPSISSDIGSEGLEVLSHTTEGKEMGLPWLDLLLELPFYLWCIGALAVLARSILGIAQVLRLIWRAEVVEVSPRQQVYISDTIETPFSFMGRIILPRDLYADTSARGLILRHEEAHCAQRHHYDLLLTQTCLILHWWNPLLWLFARSHHQTLEYLADLSVIRSGTDRRSYQQLLLETSLRTPAESLRLSFSVHNLKKRIKMMNNPTTPSKLYQRLCLSVLLSGLSVGLLTATNALATPSLPVSSTLEETTLQAPPTSPDEEPIADILEHMPSYPGGTEALYKTLVSLIKYPEEAQKNNIQGRVIVNFVIDAKGSVVSPKVMRQVDPLLDAEALRVVSLLKFNPGMKDGKPVACRYTLPIQFRISTPPPAIVQEVDENSEDMPRFSGGTDADMMKHIAQTIQYPEEAYKNNIQGRVMVGFTVLEDGSTSEIKVLRGVHPLLDAEAARVTKTLKFIPAKKDGKPVKCGFTIPISFRIDDKKSPKA